MSNITIIPPDPIQVDDYNWDEGTLYKPGLWATYTILNYLGAFLAIPVAIFIFRKPDARRTFMLLYIFGIFGMAITCATQCFINWLSGTNEFQLGRFACQFEAHAHVSNIMIQFYGVALIGLHVYLKIVKEYEISLQTARIISVGVLIVAYGGTALLSLVSPIYLMPAGAYCFFKFSSPVMIMFDFVMVITTILLVFVHIATYRKIKQTSSNVAGMSRASTDDIAKKFLKTALIFVGVFFFGWFSAIPATIYELAVGPIWQLFDTQVGVLGSFHSPLGVIVTGYFIEELRIKVLNCDCTCQDNTVSKQTMPDSIVLANARRKGSALPDGRKSADNSPIATPRKMQNVAVAGALAPPRCATWTKSQKMSPPGTPGTPGSPFTENLSPGQGGVRYKQLSTPPTGKGKQPSPQNKWRAAIAENKEKQQADEKGVTPHKNAASPDRRKSIVGEFREKDSNSAGCPLVISPDAPGTNGGHLMITITTPPSDEIRFSIPNSVKVIVE
jgi:hypothetical protein